MFIGFDAKRVFNNRTGLGNYSRILLRDLHALQSPPQMALFTPKVSLEHDFLIHQQGVKRVLPKAGFKHFGSIWRSYQLAKEANVLGVNVFHGLSNELPQGLEKYKIPSVVTIHDLIFLERPELYAAADRLIYKHKFEQACKRANLVLATSEATKRDILKHFKIKEEKVKVLYQDCHDGFAQNFSAQEKELVLKQLGISTPYLLSVGTLEKRKNHLRLIKAYHENKLYTHQLILVGKRADAAPEIDAYITQHKLERYIKIIEGIDLHKLQVLYSSAAVFVYISEIEGFGIPVLEAMKAGIPTICSNISSMPEVAGNAALLVDPINLAEIKSALSELVQTETTRNELKQKMPEQVEKFNGKKLAGRLLSMYESL